jgi:integrase
MLLTACRRGEASAALWRDVDLDAGTWTLPRTKNGTEHVIPLSRQAIDLLRSLRPTEVDPDNPVLASHAGKTLNDWEGATRRVQVASGTANWHRHDLRRTAATMMGMLGTIPDIIEAALNHATIHSPLAMAYNRSRYRPEVAKALQRLADALDNIETESGQEAPCTRDGQNADSELT